MLTNTTIGTHPSHCSCSLSIKIFLITNFQVTHFFGGEEPCCTLDYDVQPNDSSPPDLSSYFSTNKQKSMFDIWHHLVQAENPGLHTTLPLHQGSIL